MLKPLLKKLLKFVFILILSLIILQCIGYLAYTYGFDLSSIDGFISRHAIGSLFIQLLVIGLLIYVWPYVVKVWLDTKIKSNETSLQELDKSDKEFFDFICSRKFAVCFLGILFVVVNIL
jgi:uncharacterized membrane protein